MGPKCPACNSTFNPELAGVRSVSLPPTGGDYDWAEGEESANCPNCGEFLYLVVRRSLSGGSPELQSIKLGDNPDWSSAKIAWSSNGKFLAVSVKNGVKIYYLKSQKWELVANFASYHLLNWDKNDLVLIAKKSYEIWDINKMQIKHSYPREPEYWHSRNEERIEGNLLLISGFKKYCIQHIYIKNLETNQTYSIDTTESEYDTSKVWFNLKRKSLLCARYSSFRKNNTLELWNFDSKTGNLSLAASYIVAISNFEWAEWTKEGDILVSELHNEKGLAFYENLPYGLVLLDGKTLAVKKRKLQLGSNVCPREIGLRQAMIIKNTKIVWCNDKIHSLDLENFNYLDSFPFSISNYTTVSIQSQGNFVAVNTANDVLILDLSNNTKWSLRNEKLV